VKRSESHNILLTWALPTHLVEVGNGSGHSSAMLEKQESAVQDSKPGRYDSYLRIHVSEHPADI
jgi:hypothetical protein